MAKEKVSSTYACPYDGDFCEILRKRLNRWREAVEYNAANKTNQVFYTGPDMFKCSDKERKNCVRYKRYLYIVNNMKQNAK